MRKRLKFLTIAFMVVMIFVPVNIFAAEEYGYSQATASGRAYDGTDKVMITDMIFANFFVKDDVSADGEGTLSSPNAGVYDTVDGTHFVLKGSDKDWYAVDYNKVFQDIPLKNPVVITKAVPDIEIVSAKEVKYGTELSVFVKIKNDYGRAEGLPTESQMDIKVSNAKLKDGTSITRKGNEYKAVFVINGIMDGDTINVSANVSDSAVNYDKLKAPVKQSVKVTEIPESAKPQEPDSSAVIAQEKDQSPPTGDEGYMWIYMLMAILGLSAIVGITNLRANKN